MPSGGAMPVACSTPGGNLGANDTCSFRSLSPCKNSGRLFLLGLLRARHEPLPNVVAGVVVGVALVPTDRTPDQGSPWPIALAGFAGTIACDLGATPGTLPTGVFRIDPAADDPCVPGFIPAEVEGFPTESIRPFGVGAATVLSSLWLEGAQMLKDQQGRPLRLGEIHDTSTQAMGHVFVQVADLGPKGGVIRLPFGDDAGLAPVAGNPS
jgi:hypothetical protein